MKGRNVRIATLTACLILLGACEGQDVDDGLDGGARPSANSREQADAPVPAAVQTPDGFTSAPDAEADRLSPCQMQGTERLPIKPFRALGTEPFWSARVQGRCVTYSTPEDQQGTRVWTRYSPGSNGDGSWIGRLDDRPFELRTRAAPGCSDGMSDKSYPIAAELIVNGEQRRGCAEPL